MKIIPVKPGFQSHTNVISTSAGRVSSTHHVERAIARRTMSYTLRRDWFKFFYFHRLLHRSFPSFNTRMLRQGPMSITRRTLRPSHTHLSACRSRSPQGQFPYSRVMRENKLTCHISSRHRPVSRVYALNIPWTGLVNCAS